MSLCSQVWTRHGSLNRHFNLRVSFGLLSVMSDRDDVGLPPPRQDLLQPTVVFMSLRRPPGRLQEAADACWDIFRVSGVLVGPEPPGTLQGPLFNSGHQSTFLRL